VADISSYIVAIPGFIAGVGGLLLARNSKEEIKQKADMTYVTLTREATDLLLARMEELKADHSKCQRNIITLRNALLAGGIPVPFLE
jgi:hypothetical protein